METLNYLLDLQATALENNDIQEASDIERELDILSENPDTYNLPYNLQPTVDYIDSGDYDYDTRWEECDLAGGFGLISHI